MTPTFITMTMQIGHWQEGKVEREAVHTFHFDDFSAPL